MIIKIKYCVLILCLFCLNFCRPLWACDMSAFEQTEFSERCQRLIDYCQKAYITLITEHPDTEKRLSEVSKDWIDFYLSHGKKDVQPPNMIFIEAEIWERNLKDLGTKFKCYLDKKIDSEEKLKQLHGSFKAANLCEKDFSKIENFDLWLDARLRLPYSMIWAYEEELSDLVLDLNITVEDHIDAIERFKKIVKDETKNQEAKQSLFNAINKSIDQTLDKWETAFFYK